jgi:hypothetical protein
MLGKFRMEDLSRYWKICRISFTYNRAGYEYRLLPVVQEFFQSKFSDSSTALNSIQSTLLSHFQAQRSEDALINRAQTGLCLRCRISYPILQACKQLGNIHSSNPQFTYYDLLPFVLNDDGRDLIILDQDGQTHLKLDGSDTPQSVTFKLFTVEVLRTFKADSPSSMSLDNWAFLQTIQQPDLKKFLSEVGCQHLTDWALLNRVRPKQLEQLFERDRHLIEAFHAVYRRDRPQQRKGSRWCLDTNDSQLAEMVDLLQQRGISLKTHELMQVFRQVAKQLR